MYRCLRARGGEGPRLPAPRAAGRSRSRPLLFLCVVLNDSYVYYVLLTL